MTRWLLVRGRGDRPLEPAVRVDEIRRHSSSKRPTVQRGELAVLYAAVWQAVFAVVEVMSEPENDPARERWQWSFGIRPLVSVSDLHAAPAAEEASIFPKSLWRHSHIRLTDEQFARAETRIRCAAEGSGGRRRERHEDGVHEAAQRHQTLGRRSIFP